MGLARSTAAFHLDRLAEEGLLAVELKRLTGRTGPGSGRPAKLYRRAAGEVVVSVPERHYDLVGQLLLTAIEESTRTGEPAADSLLRIAGETGRRLGSGVRSLQQFLENQGYEPRPDGDGGLVLGNCPFHRLAQQHTEVVCHVNVELLRGASESVTEPGYTMVLDPGIDRCCVRAVPAPTAPADTLSS